MYPVSGWTPNLIKYCAKCDREYINPNSTICNECTLSADDADLQDDRRAETDRQDTISYCRYGGD
jgi:hypothetical protein